MTSVCRVCLSSDQSVRPVKNDQLISVYDKLSINLFNSADARPRVLCCPCYQNLINCFVFSEMVLKSEGILSQLFSNGVLEVTPKSIAGLNVKIQQQVSAGEANGNTSTVFIKEEPHSDKEEGAEDYIHIEVTPILSDGEIKTENGEVDKKNESVLLSQVRPPVSKGTFDCDSCGKSFNKRSKLMKHTKRNTLNEKTYCSRTSRLMHEGHMTIISGDKPYACSVCGKLFSEKSKLVRHISIHAGQKPYDCSVCKKQFIRKNQMEAHMRVHTGEKPHACTACDKQFTEKSILVKHMKIHSGERPFSCHACGKRFIEKSDMVKHMRTHTGEKPYACTVCKKQFTRKDVLENHKKLHTGEKPFTCSVCEKKFKRKSNMEKHMKLFHPVEKPPEEPLFVKIKSEPDSPDITLPTINNKTVKEEPITTQQDDDV